MSSDQLRKYMDLLESIIFEDEEANDNWLKANGWEETHGIGLWTKDGNDRWIIDTNPGEVVLVHDEVAGYGEPSGHFDTAEEAVDYITDQNNISSDGKVFYVCKHPRERYAEGYVLYYDDGGQWVEYRDEAKLMTRNDARSLLDTLRSNGNRHEDDERPDIGDIRWRR